MANIRTLLIAGLAGLALSATVMAPAQAVALTFDTRENCVRYRDEHRNAYPNGYCVYHSKPNSAYYPRWQFVPN